MSPPAAVPPAGGASFYTEDELRAIGLGRCGRNVLVSRHARIYSPGSIEIGDHTRIDDFCIVSGRVRLGRYVHIAAYVALYGGGGIEVGDYAGVSARTLVYSVSDDFSGEYLAGPTIPEACRRVASAPVRLDRFSLIGAASVILPGVTVHEGASIGAMSLVRDDAPAWKVCVGVPAKPIRDRGRGMVARAAALDAAEPHESVARSREGPRS